MKTPREDLFWPESYHYERVTRNLPHELPCNNLYKITVREETYLEIREHFIDLTNDPNIDGVYEQQVSKLLNSEE
jgi:DNA polymerase epsilon subunit 1